MCISGNLKYLDEHGGTILLKAPKPSYEANLNDYLKKDNNLKIENCELDLRTIFENYNGLEDNSLDLINFINEYKENNKANFEEKNGEIIMKTKSNKDNKYLKNKTLYINKQRIMPTKLIIQDNNQNMTIIIEYIEVELNI